MLTTMIQIYCKRREWRLNGNSYWFIVLMYQSWLSCHTLFCCCSNLNNLLHESGSDAADGILELVRN